VTKRADGKRTLPHGFTLLEVLVAVALLGIAVTVVLQLFSANLRTLAASEDYVAAVTRAEVKMRELLDQESLIETAWTETSEDGHIMDVSITETLKERTESLQVSLFEIVLTVRWSNGGRERSLTVRTLKAVPKQV
jgi:prepilin-type N-terminal cleavage/methylation domain-containing protein